MEDHSMERETMTVTEAARRLGLDKETIRRYLRDGKLRGKKNIITGFWRIDAESVREVERGGRPDLRR